MSVTDKVALVFASAKKHAAADPHFHTVLGPGGGDYRTKGFMAHVGLDVLYAFCGTPGPPATEQRICGENSLAVDFYFPEEATIVEIAVGLPNPGSEFEKDILTSAAKKCRQPGRAAMICWAHEKHGLEVEVLELDGEPRVRRRRPR